MTYGSPWGRANDDSGTATIPPTYRPRDARVRLRGRSANGCPVAGRTTGGPGPIRRGRSRPGHVAMRCGEPTPPVTTLMGAAQREGLTHRRITMHVLGRERG